MVWWVTLGGWETPLCGAPRLCPAVRAGPQQHQEQPDASIGASPRGTIPRRVFPTPGLHRRRGGEVMASRTGRWRTPSRRCKGLPLATCQRVLAQESNRKHRVGTGTLQSTAVVTRESLWREQAPRLQRPIGALPAAQAVGLGRAHRGRANRRGSSLRTGRAAARARLRAADQRVERAPRDPAEVHQAKRSLASPLGRGRGQRRIRRSGAPRLRTQQRRHQWQTHPDFPSRKTARSAQVLLIRLKQTLAQGRHPSPAQTSIADSA